MSANIQFKIEKLSQFAHEGPDSRRLSDAVYLHGLPWKILAIPRELALARPPPRQKCLCLGYYLQCNVNNKDPAWSCHGSATLKILAQKEGKEDHERKITHVFSAKENARGFAQFETFEALMDPVHGLYDKETDSMILSVDFTADEPQGIKLPDVVYKQYTILGENTLSVGFDKKSTNKVQLDDKSWEFAYLPVKETLSLKMSKNSSKNGKTIAELIFWFWEDNKIAILQKYVHTFGPDSRRIVVPTKGSKPVNKKFNVVIRVLEPVMSDRDSMESSYFGNFEGIDMPMVTLCVVGPEEASFVVPKIDLIRASPVFQRMFVHDMTEKASGKIEIKDTNPEEFGDFLKALSPKQEHPNPSNVLALLKLADRYDCQLLRDRCEKHLMNCVELPLLELFTCADSYNLNKLKKHLLANFNETGLFKVYEQSKPYLELLALVSKMNDEGI